jgi:hypothetical protein
MPVTFDTSTFLASYPQFTAFNTASPGSLVNYFVQSTLYLNNVDGLSVVSDIPTRQFLLYMLTAHIAEVEGALLADRQFRPTGRLTMAKQGDAETRSEYLKPTPGTSPWFQQTQNGAAFWQATSQYRRFVYRTRPLIPL